MSVGLQGLNFLRRPRPTFSVEDLEETPSEVVSSVNFNTNDTDRQSSLPDSSTNPLSSLGPQINVFTRPLDVEGTPGTVNRGSLTLTNAEDESLTVERNSNLSFTIGEDDTITIQSSSTGESLTAKPGTNLALEGEGELMLFGENAIGGIDGGTSLEFLEEDDEIRAVIPPEETRLELGRSETFLDVKSTRPDQTDSLTIFGNAGQTLAFEQGESGTIEEGEDGAIIVTNADQDRSITLENGFSLLGEAEGILSSSNQGDRITLVKGSRIRSAATEEGVSLTRIEGKPTEIRLDPRDAPSTDGPIRFALRGDADVDTFRTLTTNLLSPEETDSGRGGQERAGGTGRETEGNRTSARLFPTVNPLGSDAGSSNGSTRTAGSRFSNATVASRRLNSLYTFEPAFATNTINVFA